MIKIKLTEEQSKLVEDNHSLIYWYINLKGLNQDEWYDLLAIELCKAVQKHNKDKSGIANYFKLRADFLVRREYFKNKVQKRSNNGMYDIEELFADDTELVKLSYDYNEDIMENILLKDLTSGEFGDIIKLKWEGYTQGEIAEMLGVSQSYISKALKKVRDELDE